jgi:hypothetical protein
LVRRDGSGLLSRSTLGAVLRYDRSLSREVLVRILAACEVSDAEHVEWMAVWEPSLGGRAPPHGHGCPAQGYRPPSPSAAALREVGEVLMPGAMAPASEIMGCKLTETTVERSDVLGRQR